MQRLAVLSKPPVLLAAAVVAGLAGIQAAGRLLLPDAPRFSDSRVSARQVVVETPDGDPDLDGDGIADRFDGIFESCGEYGCAYEVYLRRPYAADQYVGRMQGFWPFTIEHRSDDPADVIAVWHRGVSESIGTRYRFANGAYRTVSDYDTVRR